MSNEELIKAGKLVLEKLSAFAEVKFDDFFNDDSRNPWVVGYCIESPVKGKKYEIKITLSSSDLKKSDAGA